MLSATWREWRPSGPRLGVHTLSADAHALALAAETGFDTVVELFSWRQIEPTRNEWHWQHPDEVVAGAAYYGLDLVVRLDQHPAWAASAPLTVNAPPDDLEDYARFVEQVARRYRGRVRGYIIWNEPNLALEWGGRPPDPSGYTRLLCRAYQAVKDADSSALVVSAGLASTNHNDAEAMDDRLYLEAMLQAGAGDCFDVLGAHPYGFGYPPDDPRGAHEGLNMARIEDLRERMVAYGLAHKPIWATEMGWTVDGKDEHAWHTVTPAQQADYLVAALRRARRDWPWLELLTVWNLPGLGAIERLPDEFLGYSLVDTAGEPRPALVALQAAASGRRASLSDRWRRWRSTLRLSDEDRYVVLAPDAVIHLGDSEFGRPWRPLFGARNPSTLWQGVVYVPAAALARPGDWRLSLRLMQVNTPDNYVWVNGRRLEPALPGEDFSGSWVSVTLTVPGAWLQPGANTIALTVGRTLPVLQDTPFTWDDLQVKDVVLWRSVRGR
jgi:hypothetical protein